MEYTLGVVKVTLVKIKCLSLELWPRIGHKIYKIQSAMGYVHITSMSICGECNMFKDMLSMWALAN